MAKDIGPLTLEVLKKCGYSDSKINKFSGQTRLYHDLGMWGDDSIEFLELIEKDYNVDLSNFPLDDYFRPEFYHGPANWKKRLKWLILGREKRKSYKEFTLNMLERTLATKKWEFS